MVAVKLSISLSISWSFGNAAWAVAASVTPASVLPALSNSAVTALETDRRVTRNVLDQILRRFLDRPDRRSPGCGCGLRTIHPPVDGRPARATTTITGNSQRRGEAASSTIAPAFFVADPTAAVALLANPVKSPSPCTPLSELKRP